LKFLTVAKVLIANQIRIYRSNKVVAIANAVMLITSTIGIFILAGVVFSPVGKNFVLTFYKTLTGYVTVDDFVLYVSSVVSALIFAGGVKSDRITVNKSKYPILYHPISLRDFLIGSIISETFIAFIFSVPYVLMFYALTLIAGNTLSAVLAWIVLILGLTYCLVIYESIVLINDLTRCKLKPLWIALATLSLFDAFTKKVTVSIVYHVVLGSIVNCYRDFNVLPFFVAFALSLLLLSVLSGFANPDFELITFTRGEKEARVGNIKGVFSKAILEFRRMGLFKLLIAMPLLFVLGNILKDHVPSYFSDFIPIYVSLFVLSLSDVIALQEAGMLWFYRIHNAVGDYVISMLIRSIIFYIVIVSLSFSFVIPMGVDLTTVLVVFSLLMFFSGVQALITTFQAPKIKFKTLKFLGMYESDLSSHTMRFVYTLIETIILMFVAVAVTINKLLALTFPVIWFVTIPIIKRVAKDLDLA